MLLVGDQVAVGQVLARGNDQRVGRRSQRKVRDIDLDTRGAVAEEAEKVRASVRKRWGAAVPFVPLGDDEKSEKVFGPFLEIFR